MPATIGRVPVTLHFLGASETVTGSQYLLETDRARLLIDCGMFQGPPDQRIRNYVPFAFDPPAVDAMLLTHAHLDHCGLIPRLVADGYRGPIHATAGTVELAALVLLDSGRLQEEFARREMRWERRHPEKAVADDARETADYRAALQLAGGEALRDSPAIEPPGDAISGEHVPTTIEPAAHIQPPQASDDHHFGELGVDLDAPLYTERQARSALERFRPLAYDRELEVAPGMHATLLDAGHILGSAIIVVRVEGAGDERDLTIVFSGDLGRPGAPILRDYTAVNVADYVLVETTYGGREHQPEAEALRVLAETIRLVAENDGVLLIPSFAIGRTQEIVYQLDRLLGEGKIPELPLYLDSPMGSRATAIYRRHTDYFDTEASHLQRAGETPLDYPRQVVTNDVADSQKIEHAERPYMIVASNGMLTGGRIVGHLRNLLEDPSATLLFVGYQASGTLGASLQGGARTARVEGQLVTVRCNVRSISGFSAHADESQLLAWLAGFADHPPGKVFLVHGDPEAQAAIEPKIRALGYSTYTPRWREALTLTRAD